ncbi:unnamed protein product [Trichobilharzia szidati]|nr:unnamed protein product [Trichobilharzia szidati]
MLKDTNWDLFTEQALDNTISNITHYLNFCLDVCCPKETIFLKFDRFASSQLKKLRRQKERLYKMKNKSGVKRINTLIKAELQRLNALYNQKFLSCKSSSNMWKLLKEITGGKQIMNDTSVDVDMLNKSFICIPADVMIPKSNSINNDCFSCFNTNDVLKCLQSLKPTQSLGPDGVPAVILKKCADILCYPLTDIFNESFSKGFIPDSWKNIKVVPVPKSTSGPTVKFRPIAITSPFLKVMERLILLNLEPSLKPFNDPNQFAYKHSRCTLDAAVVLYHNIVSSLDRGAKYVRCAFLDYTSAFDSVPRSLLLSKLAATQSESWINKWLYSYFSDRKQYTVYNGKSSSTSLTLAGVTQGAVLSPFLFSFFLHDLPHSDVATFVKYADDLSVSMPVNSQSDCSILNNFLSEISQWSSSNGLKLNPSKCQVVNFTFRRKHDLQQLASSHGPTIIDGIEVETTSDVKYLGLSISSDLSWSSHILLVTRKMFRLTFYLRKFRQSGIKQSLLSQFVNSCILPIPLYCSPLIFPGLLKKDFASLRRALKAVSRASGISLNQLVNTIVDRHIMSCKKLANSILSDPEHPLYTQLSPCISSGRTRSNYRKLYARTTKYKNSTIPYLAQLLCDEKTVRHDMINLLRHSNK